MNRPVHGQVFPQLFHYLPCHIDKHFLAHQFLCRLVPGKGIMESPFLLRPTMTFPSPEVFPELLRHGDKFFNHLRRLNGPVCMLADGFLQEVAEFALPENIGAELRPDLVLAGVPLPDSRAASSSLPR